MNILDLPWDVLHEIFVHLRDPRVRTAPGEPGWRWQLSDDAIPDDLDAGRIQAVKNARLTCHAFNRAASPLLVPWVLVSVDRASLAKVDAISRNPLVASGVRGIKVDASYYPAELAADIVRFVERQKHDLQDEGCYTSSYFGSEDEEEARANCAFIVKAWVNALTSTAGGSDARANQYQTLLRDAHDEFRRRHQETSGLVADGSFVKSLAQSISRMPTFSSLWISDKNPRSKRDLHDPLETFNDRHSLVAFLVSPFVWRSVEKMTRVNGEPDGGMELAVASLIRDLPIAIHAAGAHLKDFRLWVFPNLQRNRALLDPIGREPELRNAFQHLKHFQLVDCAASKPDLHLPPPPELLAPKDRYLAAVVSAPKLRTLRLHFPRRVPIWSRYAVAPILNAVASDRLTVLSLEGAVVKQSDLDHLLGRLGDRPAYIELSRLSMQDGKWSPVVDLVRRRVDASCAEKKCAVKLDELIGGEFVQRPERVLVANWRRGSYPEIAPTL